jgi:hypothetical protein
MKYTLITAKGKVYIFNVAACAEAYKQAFGGVVFTQQILETAVCPKMAVNV